MTKVRGTDQYAAAAMPTIGNFAAADDAAVLKAGIAYKNKGANYQVHIMAVKFIK